MRKAIDLFLVYQFLRRLSTPFSRWDAYKTGVISDTGEILINKTDRSDEQKKAFGVFDLMILKLKKLLAKVPGGTSRIASYMAALWLIKEWNHFSDSSLLNESTSESDLDFSSSLFLEWYLYYIPILQKINQKVNEDEGGVPTVNAGSGNIAGLGVGPQGEPGLTRSQQSKHKKRAAATSADLARRKLFASFIGEALPDEAGYYPQEDSYEPDRVNIERKRKFKKHPRSTEENT